tara:strand:- start:232 stop:1098 length:867 start_codon:yes stop_codon:yes gene_type:complete
MATDIKYQFSRLNIAEKIIAFNVLIFIVTRLTAALFGYNLNTMISWFELPENLNAFIQQPWSIVTYSFLHGDFGHLFWNMLMLYFTGRIFMNLYGERKFINVYFIGLIFGGLIFLASYNLFPALLNHNNALIGASAGVAAVLIFVCTYTPNQEVRVIFFNVKLWHLGAVFVLADLIQIGYSANVGGRLSHLGGAFVGYYYARKLLGGKDVGEWFSQLLDSFMNLFRKSTKAPMKTVYRKPNSTIKKSVNYEKETHQRKVDLILDKISKSGYESLSKAEKDFLFKAGKE